MPEATSHTPVPLFTPDITSAATSLTSDSSFGTAGFDMSQTDKDAILRQIHPIFLTTHSDEKKSAPQSNFDKFLGFMRLCLEGLLKFVDIVVDAVIQVARLFVWVVAIAGVLIVVTLMTNTTDKFIDLLNSSVFPIIGLETKIQKVTNDVPAPVLTEDSSTSPDTVQSSAITDNIQKDELTAAEKARQALIEARKARLNPAE